MNKITCAFIFSLIGFNLLLSGCGSVKDANKDNFAKAIAKKIEKSPQEIPRTYQHGLQSNRYCSISVNQIGTETPYSGKEEEALANAGLLTVKSTRTDTSFRNIEYKTYELSDKGKEIATKGNYNSYHFPYCQVKFKEVLSFTEPSDGGGAKVSKVKYTFTLEKFPDWVKNEELLKTRNFSTIKERIELEGKPIESEQYLVLTNEGWSTGD
jgi:hypothetical protein